MFLDSFENKISSFLSLLPLPPSLPLSLALSLPISLSPSLSSLDVPRDSSVMGASHFLQSVLENLAGVLQIRVICLKVDCTVCFAR